MLVLFESETHLSVKLRTSRRAHRIMQFRTFVARDMKEALAHVRAEMGVGAVIIATQQAGNGGVMVRATLDETKAIAHTEPDVTVHASNVADFEDHYRDATIRRLRADAPVARGAARFDRAQLVGALLRHRTPISLAHALAEDALQAQLTDMTLALASAIDKRMTPAPIDLATASAFLLDGPNGAGKTTVAAKIAAQALIHRRRITLVACNSSVAGAVARLESFAKHLDAAMTSIDSAAKLNKLVADCVAKKTLAIIDTAGFDARDAKTRSAFAALGQIGHVETIGVVSVLCDAEEISEIGAALNTLGAGRLIATGLDLARRAGALLAAATQQTPLVYVTRSPFVASGLEPPTALSLARLVLGDHRSAQ